MIDKICWGIIGAFSTFGVVYLAWYAVHILRGIYAVLKHSEENDANWD